MFKPVHRAQVDEKTVSRIVRLIDFLAKITPPNEHPTLQNFIQAFQSRYEEAEVPLAVALDGELGLGYPVSSGSGDVNPLINDLVFPGRYSNAVTVTQTPADRILFEKYIENARKGGHVVLLEDKDFEKLDYKHQFPDTIAVMCSLLDNDLINIKSIGGVCAANLFGALLPYRREYYGFGQRDRRFRAAANSGRYLRRNIASSRITHRKYRLAPGI